MQVSIEIARAFAISNYSISFFFAKSCSSGVNS